MSKKNKLIFITLGLINLTATILLIALVLPEKIPFLVDLNEKIVSQISKWIMLLSSIIPTIFVTILVIIKNKKTQFFLKILFILAIFENILYFSYFCISKNLNIGELHEVPISVSIFMPIAVIISICATKLKNVPYLSKPAINFKPTRETEFIWGQTQIYARDVYFATGVILFLISIVFCFVRYCLIELCIYFLAIIVSTIIIYRYSKSIYNKYMDMKRRQEIVNKNKKVKEE